MTRALQFFFLLAIGISFLAPKGADAQWTPMNPVRKVQQETDSILFTMFALRRSGVHRLADMSGERQ